jgi:tetratricopeptide (TPR) repeat protein
MKKIFLLTLMLFMFFVCSNTLADVITLKNSCRIIEGKVIQETQSEYIVKLKGGGECRLPKIWVKEIKGGEIPQDELYTVRDIYQQKVQELDKDDGQANYDFGLWCLKNGLFEVAQPYFEAAKTLQPSLTSKCDNKITYINNMLAEKMLVYAQGNMKNGNYIDTERIILDILNSYPDSEYRSETEDVLIMIWGQGRAKEIIAVQDGLPPVATTAMEMRGTLGRIQDAKIRESYLLKCYNKAQMLEQRSEEVASQQKAGYLSEAKKCYQILSVTADGKVKDMADNRLKDLEKKVNIAHIIPKDGGVTSSICDSIKNSNNQKDINSACNYYYKLGYEYIRKAKTAKGKEKIESATIARNAYSIVYYFSSSDNMKTQSLKYMRECESMMR